MALINCPECGKEISDQANACPHCGYPTNGNQIDSIVQPPQDETTITGGLPKDFPVGKRKRRLGIPPEQRKTSAKEFYSNLIGGLLIFLVAAGGVLLFSWCATSSSSIDGKNLDDFISRVEYDEFVQAYDIYLSPNCDWDNLSSSDRVKIARYCISKYREKDGVLTLGTLGYTSSGALAFSEIKTFKNGKPDVDL